MKLVLNRDQKKSLTGKAKFKLDAVAELTPNEKRNIDKYKMGKTLLYTNLENRGKGLLGVISRAAMGIEITVDDLVSGKTVECKDILEMIALEGQVAEACESFKLMLDTAANFGGSVTLEF
jgi:hypothetical protein